MLKGPKSECLLFWSIVVDAICSSYTKQTISDLLQNKVDMSQLVITKALAKSGESLTSGLLSEVELV